MKNYLVTFLCLLCFIGNAQENYSALVKKAKNKAWEAKDDIDNQVALDLFEKAFSMFPDSVVGPDIYEASLVSSNLKKNNKAFEYLVELIEIKTEADGFPTWNYIVGNNSVDDYKNLISDPRWQVIKERALIDKKEFFDRLAIKEKEFFNRKNIDFKKIKNPKKLYEILKNENKFEPKQDRDYSIRFYINDSTTTSYFIHLPNNYNPNKKYPLLFFLHGAVRSSELIDFQLPNWNLEWWNRYYTKYADLNDVILVFPTGNKLYNWMTSDDGFFMIPEILKAVKTAIHIDDDKVFISGHSNGATGSFSYLMKQPTPFSGFYGFNTYPKVFTGGTFVENIKNRSFINFSTDQDYYYPPNANDDFTKLMNEIQGDYKEYRFNGFPHWFPQFDESESAYEILFDDLNKRKRNPFPKEITWEFDDDRYGAVDWLSEIKLDSLSSKAIWHKQLNFKIEKWLVYDKNDSLLVNDVDKKAFDFPRKSGKIVATYSNNIFKFKTSNVSSFSINISPEMIQINKPVQVYVNDKLYFNKKITYNREFMLSNFEKFQDRQQIWINQIHFQIK